MLASRRDMSVGPFSPPVLLLQDQEGISALRSSRWRSTTVSVGSPSSWVSTTSSVEPSGWISSMRFTHRVFPSSTQPVRRA